MIVPQKEVEIQKFKMFAERVNTEDQAINLCKKYLKHKGIDLNPTMIPIAPPVVQKIYMNKDDVEFMRHQVVLDRFHIEGLSPSEKMQMQSQLHKEIADHLVYEMLKRDLVRLETYEDLCRAQTIHSATVGIWRGK